VWIYNGLLFLKNFGMKTLNYILFSLLILAFISCDVQKRRYQKGMYVSSRHAKIKAHPIAEHTLEQNKIQVQDEVSLSADAGGSQVPIPLGLLKKQSPPPADTCDILLFRDGSEIRAKITEVNNLEVRYKRCDNIDGPDFLTRKSDLFMIKYANGTREVIKEEAQIQRPLPSRPGTAPRQTTNLGQQPLHPAANGTLLMGIISLVSLIFALVFNFWFVVSAISGAINTIRKFRQFNKQDRAEPGAYRGRGRAVTGLVLAIVTLSILFIFLLLLVLILLLM
jgi:hypothetical protein